MSRFLIYGLVDPRTDEVRYIGKSSSGLVRPKRHFFPSVLKEKNYKANWLRNVIAAGHSAPVVVLEELDMEDALNDAECFWIAQGRGLGWPLTNLTAGGEGTVGVVRSAATRAKSSAATRAFFETPGARERQSEAQRKRFETAPVTAETRARISAAGRIRDAASPETREKLRAAAQLRQSPEYSAKLSAALRRRVVTEATRAKLSAWSRGRVFSDEVRAKMSAAQTGRQHSAETRAKMSASGKGRVVSEETRAKIRAARLGTKASDEARAKMSAASKGRKKSAETRARMSAAWALRRAAK